jgi:hypothetical protein
MPELEQRLRQLGGELAWPPEPRLAPRVAARLAADSCAPRATGRRRTLVLALAALALAVATALAVPPARSALLELLRIGGAEIERVETLPATPPAGPLELGEPVSLAEARRRAEYAPLVPRALPEPDGVYFRRPPPGGEVSFVYRSEDGGVAAVLSQFRGDALPYVSKAAGPQTRVRRVAVGRREGVWLAGAPHVLVYQDQRGVIREQTRRLAGNVLLWERDGLTLRLEGALDLATALRIARSVE